MSVQTIIDVIKWTWCYMSFPWLLLLVTLAAVMWLWVEYQGTRVGRKTPGLHRRIPILPEISLAAVFAIRLSWLLVRLWAILFLIMVAIGIALTQKALPDDIARSIFSVSQYWREGNIWLVDKLPDAVGERLAPPESCAQPWLGKTQNIHTEAQENILEELTSASTPSPTPSPHPTVTPTPTPTPSPAFQVIILKNANVRAGPSADAPRFGRAAAGERYLVTGRNSDSTWWRILYQGKTGWIWHELVDSSAVPDNMPVFGP